MNACLFRSFLAAEFELGFRLDEIKGVFSVFKDQGIAEEKEKGRIRKGLLVEGRRK